ncbi:MAG: HisA/HisF-related TIM barrel protein [Caldilineaceae bacterium]
MTAGTFTSAADASTPASTLSPGREVERRQVGEILLTSMDGDGTQEGYDVALTSPSAMRSTSPSSPAVARGAWNTSRRR